MKNSFQNVVKRISAGFMASVVFAYSLLIAPCFGVGAVTFDWVDFVKSVGSAAIGNVSGGNAVVSLIGTLLMNVGIDTTTSKINIDNPNGLAVDMPLQNIDSFAGNATIGDREAIVTVYTHPSTTLTYTQLWMDFNTDVPTQFLLCKAVFDNGFETLRFSIEPHEGETTDSISWADDDYITVSYRYNYHSSYPGIYCDINFYNSSGEAVTRRYKIHFIDTYDTGYMETKSSDLLTGNGRTISCLAYFPPVSYSSFLNIIPSNFNTNPLYVCGTSSSVGANSKNVDFPSTFGTESISSITNENYYDYTNNIAYPYTVNKYSVWQVLSPPSDSVIPDETTEPTGTGAVIIIDPFTLPPEWVESDVVELNTEAYTIDYDTMIDDPLDEINYPLTPTNPLRGGANILSFGIQFLKDGGVFYIICTLLVIGLLIRFLGI